MHAATCVATSPLRNNPRRRGLSSDAAPLSFIARLRSTREERRAGTRPKVIPVSRLDKSAKVRTRVSGPTSSTTIRGQQQRHAGKSAEQQQNETALRDQSGNDLVQRAHVHHRLRGIDFENRFSYAFHHRQRRAFGSDQQGFPRSHQKRLNKADRRRGAPF